MIVLKRIEFIKLNSQHIGIETYFLCVLTKISCLRSSKTLNLKINMDVCKGSINSFCYICGRFMSTKNRHGSVSDDLKSLYNLYFEGQPFITDEWYVPKYVCKTCYTYLFDWKRTSGKIQMKFGVPMIWTQPKDNKHDPLNCYVCANFISGNNKSKMKNHVYKAVESAQLPLPFGGNIKHKFPSPDVMSMSTLHTTVTASTDTETVDHSLYDPGPSSSNAPILITQEKLDSIVAKLWLSQHKSEELAKFLKENHLLAPETKVTAFRKRQSAFENFFFTNDTRTYAYCNSAPILMQFMLE